MGNGYFHIGGLTIVVLGVCFLAISGTAEKCSGFSSQLSMERQDLSYESRRFGLDSKRDESPKD